MNTPPRVRRSVTPDAPSAPIAVRYMSRMPRQIRDPASYQQWTAYKSKTGRKRPRREYQARLLKAVTAPVRYAFGSAGLDSDKTGQYWLTKQWVSGTSTIGPPATDNRIYALPVYLLNLSNVNQDGRPNGDAGAGTVMYDLCYRNDLTTGVTNQGGWYYRPIPGTNQLTGVGYDQYKYTAIQPTTAAVQAVGRKGLMDWSRIKLVVYGKTKNPAQVRVSLIRFLHPDFTPEANLLHQYGSSGPDVVISNKLTPVVGDWWNARTKPLISGSQGHYSPFDNKKRIKVLKSVTLNFNPIDASAETAASDARPHIKSLDWFNRWGRINDYTTDKTFEGAGPPPNFTSMQLPNVNPPKDYGYDGYLSDPEKGIYLLIESVQPTPDDNSLNIARPRNPPNDITIGPNTWTGNEAYACSFNVHVQTNYSGIEDSGTG